MAGRKAVLRKTFRSGNIWVEIDTDRNIYRETEIYMYVYICEYTDTLRTSINVKFSHISSRISA